MLYLGVPAEKVGENAAEELLKSLHSKVCADEYLQDQVNSVLPQGLEGVVQWFQFYFQVYFHNFIPSMHCCPNLLASNI